MRFMPAPLLVDPEEQGNDPQRFLHAVWSPSGSTKISLFANQDMSAAITHGRRHLNPADEALSSMPLYQALIGRQENAHIKRGVMSPSFSGMYGDLGQGVGREQTRAPSGTGNTQTPRSVCRLSVLGRLLLRHFGRFVSRLLLVGVEVQLRHGVLEPSPFFRN